MDITELKSHIQSKQFCKFYVFTGPEWKIQQLYIRQIATVSGKELKYVDSVNDIYAKMRSGSFVQKHYVYVLIDDKDLMTNEKLQAQLESMTGDNIVILSVTTLDKRTKFYKTYKTTICEFEPLKTEIMKFYVQREISLSDKNTYKLIELCENDYGRCLLEIDKIKHWQIGYGKDKQELMSFDGCFLRLLNSRVIYQPPKDAIFEFIDAVLDDDVNRSYDLYRQCLAVGEAVMVMLSVLYQNAKAVLQVQSCKSRDIAKATGLNGWQISNAKKHLGVYRIGELVNILKTCQSCQQAIVTGTMDEEYVMDYILTSIM